MDADEDIMEEEEEGAGHLGEDGAGRGYSLERYQEHIAGRADDPPEDEDDLFDVVQDVWEMWKDVCPRGEESAVERAMEAFGLETVADTGDMRTTTLTNTGETRTHRGLAAVEVGFYQAAKPLRCIYINCATFDALNERHEIRDQEMRTTFCRAFETIRLSFLAVRAEYRRRVQIVDELYDARDPAMESSKSKMSKQNFEVMKHEKISSFQWMLLFVLHDLSEVGFRKLDGALFSEKKIPRYVRVLKHGVPICAKCGKTLAAHRTRPAPDHAFETLVREVPGSRDSVSTRAWEPFNEVDPWCDADLKDNRITDWIQYRCRKEGHESAAWWHLTNGRGGMSDDVAKQLSCGHDEELPTLRVDTAVWSFLNGIFDGRRAQFMTYGSATLQERDYTATKFIPLWFDWEAISAEMLGAPTAQPERPPSARFANIRALGRCAHCGRAEFECTCTACPTCGREECAEGCVDFGAGAAGGGGFYYPYCRDEEAFRSIRTPWFDSILAYQELGEGDTADERARGEDAQQVWKWFFVFIGRLFYEVNSEINDDWQVVLFIKGQANTGKSTIAEWVQRWFLTRSVGVLNNNAQPEFGISDLVNNDGSQKQLVVCLEVKSDFSMNQSDFQSMISGESLMVTWKHERSKLIKHWRAAMLLLGNALMGFVDNAGSMSRRLKILLFSKELTDSLRDSKLGNRLYTEEGCAALAKSILAYQWARGRYHDVSTWGTDPRTGRPIVPKHFHRTRENVREQSNSLVAYLNDPNTSDTQLVYHRNAYIPLDTLRENWKTKAQELGFHRGQQWNDDFYAPPLRRKGLRIVKERRQYPPSTGQMQLLRYVVGIGSASIDWGPAAASASAASSASSASSASASASIAPWSSLVHSAAARNPGPLDEDALTELARLQTQRGGGFAALAAHLNDADVAAFAAEWQRRGGSA